MIYRVLYFFYYLKKLDTEQFKKFVFHLSESKKMNVLEQFFSVLFCSLKYNISILEYYQFGFYEKSHIERLKWAGTGFMYEFQKIMNPPKTRKILDDKRLFYENYKSFFKHNVYRLEELENNQELIEKLYLNKKLVFKVSNGKCGISVKVVSIEELKQKGIVQFMKEQGFDMLETFVEQHEELQKLSPSAVNTVRIFTQLNSKGDVEILGCRQRISINSHIDNLAAGNIAAPINEKTGIIESAGVYSDITKADVRVHPITGVDIVGFKVPFWNECLELATQAALKYPQNRSIGWDIVVTKEGPGLIEGNHDWCKLLWQLPVKKGMKNKLLEYLN